MNFIAKYPNVINEDLCNSIIEKFNNELLQVNLSEEYSAEGHLIDPESERWKDIFPIIISLTAQKIKEYTSPIAHLCPHKYVFRSISMLRYAPGQNVPLHYDEEISPDGTGKHFICLIYLKTVLLGGELLFPLQKEVITPTAGLMVIFPTFFTHPHTVLPTVDQERFCMRVQYKVSDRVLYSEGKPSEYK